MAISKVIFNGDTLMDVTQDTVAANNLLSGETATGANGLRVNGAVAVPTKTSDLTNDGEDGTSPFATEDYVDSAVPSTYVSSFNGNSGAVTYTAPVTSVNTKTGAVSLTASDVGALPSSTAIPTKTSDLTNDSNFVVDSSYVHTDNNYTSTEKTKLSGIATGAEVNVQANWNESNSSSDAYIQNKPTIPTKTSDLTNDSGFITDAGVTSFNGNTGAVTYTAPVTSVNGNTGAVTVSVPSASSTSPNMDGTAAVGTSTDYARADHTHPVDTSRAAANNAVLWLPTLRWGTGSTTTDGANPHAELRRAGGAGSYGLAMVYVNASGTSTINTILSNTGEFLPTVFNTIGVVNSAVNAVKERTVYSGANAVTMATGTLSRAQLGIVNKVVTLSALLRTTASAKTNTVVASLASARSALFPTANVDGAIGGTDCYGRFFIQSDGSITINVNTAVSNAYLAINASWTIE